MTKIAGFDICTPQQYKWIMHERSLQRAILTLAAGVLLNTGCQPPPRTEPDKIRASVMAENIIGTDEISDYRITLPESRMNPYKGSLELVLLENAFRERKSFDQVLPPEGGFISPTRIVHVYEYQSDTLTIKAAAGIGAEDGDEVKALLDFTRGHDFLVEIRGFKPEYAYLIQGEWDKTGYSIQTVRRTATKELFDRLVIPQIRPTRSRGT